MIILKRDLPETPEPVRCWVCSSNTAHFPVGSEYGQYASYPPWVIGWWPGGVGGNRLDLDWPMLDGGSISEDESNPFSPLYDPTRSGAGGAGPCDAPDTINAIHALMQFPFIPDTEDDGRTNYYFGITALDACAGDTASAADRSSAYYIRQEPDGGNPGSQLVSAHKVHVDGETHSCADTTTGITTATAWGTQHHYVRLTFGSLGQELLEIDNSVIHNTTYISPTPNLDIRWGDIPPNAEDQETVFEACIFDGQTNHHSAVPIMTAVTTDQFDAVALSFFFSQLSQGSSTPTEANQAYWGSWSYTSDPGTIVGG